MPFTLEPRCTAGRTCRWVDDLFFPYLLLMGMYSWPHVQVHATIFFVVLCVCVFVCVCVCVRARAFTHLYIYVFIYIYISFSSIYTYISFSSIYTHIVFIYIHIHVQDGLKEVHRVLKPGGFFFATTFLWGIPDEIVNLQVCVKSVCMYV
jgi:SAM-dependent methyltransferase